MNKRFKKHLQDYETEWKWIANKLQIDFADLITVFSDYRETVEFMNQFHYDQNHEDDTEKI
jgi:hypothetical protein